MGLFGNRGGMEDADKRTSDEAMREKPAQTCRTCGFSHPEKDCPRWPSREKR